MDHVTKYAVIVFGSVQIDSVTIKFGREYGDGSKLSATIFWGASIHKQSILRTIRVPGFWLIAIGHIGIPPVVVGLRLMMDFCSWGSHFFVWWNNMAIIPYRWTYCTVPWYFRPNYDLWLLDRCTMYAMLKKGLQHPLVHLWPIKSAAQDMLRHKFAYAPRPRSLARQPDKANWDTGTSHKTRPWVPDMVNVYLRKITIFNGKTQDLDWAMASSSQTISHYQSVS